MIEISTASERPKRGLPARRSPLLEAGSDRSAARARQDYVKAIYQLGETGPVRAVDVARHLGVSAVSVSKAKAQLERDGFLERDETARNHLRLSAHGRALAISVLRCHRLVETFLHRSLGVPLERIHAEAERIEHVISEDIAERLAVLLGNPTQDPHGHPIPTPANELPAIRSRRLASVAAGVDIRVISLDDRDAGVVRFLASVGVLPGLQASVVAVDAEHVHLRWAMHDAALSLTTAEAVRVLPVGRREGS